jgi:putative transposase
VQRDGIRFASTRYVSPVLAAYIGETVTIRYDPRDAAELRVYHHDQYLCRAIAPELAADAVTLQQLQQARTARRKQLKQQLRERRSLAGALPTHQRHLPPTACAEAPAAEPPAAMGSPAVDLPLPRHRLRTYATD